MSNNDKEKLSKWCVKTLTGKPKSFALREGGNLIGRVHTASIQTNSKFTSRKHGSIIVHGNNIEFLDVSSRGTKIIRKNLKKLIYIKVAIKKIYLGDQFWLHDTGFKLDLLDTIDLTEKATINSKKTEIIDLTLDDQPINKIKIHTKRLNPFKQNHKINPGNHEY